MAKIKKEQPAPEAAKRVAYETPKDRVSDRSLPNEDPAKVAAVRELAKKLNTNLRGEGRIYMGDEHPETKFKSSGVLALDVVCGGGLPCGQLVELFGPGSSTKSLLCHEACAAEQERGGIAAWLAGETYDKDWARKRGVDPSKVFLVDGSSGDTMLETGLSLLESGAVGIIVFDSFQSLGTTREMEAGVESESYGNGGAPQMWGRIMRRAYRLAAQGKLQNTALLGISQARAKIGATKGYAAEDGQPIQVRAIQHWKAVSIRCRAGEVLTTEPRGGGRVYDREFILRCEKNKVAPTDGWKASYHLRVRDWEGIPKGVDNYPTIFEFATAYELIKRSGSWYSFGDEKIGQGEGQALTWLRGQPEVARQLTAEILRSAHEGL